VILVLEGSVKDMIKQCFFFSDLQLIMMGWEGSVTVFVVVDRAVPTGALGLFQ
jgi:hypothetical protein